jgi:hypothetical protein
MEIGRADNAIAPEAGVSRRDPPEPECEGPDLGGPPARVEIERMNTIHDTPVIVNVGPCECHAVTTTRVHHRDLPELHAEGMTAVEACKHLENLLLRAYDNAPSGFRREAIDRALCDVKEFIASQE